ncbi:MAG TPA: response regulator [Nitrospirales bacterium]|nr:response regulator [Nitrospira sp. MA-1]HNP61877.1 response regulator [Nitrospirales bacterium]
MKSQKCVLIVDDDADVRLFLRDRLNAMGFEVLTAANGKEGVETLRHHSVDGVLLDLYMPVMGGILMLEQLAQFSVFPPVIVMSSTTHRSELQFAIIKGAMDFLIKPIAPEELTDKCMRLFY